MFVVDWQNLKEEDLKDKEFLVKAFRKFLKKDCKYSAEEAKFSADVIEEPFARNYHTCKKTLDAVREINSKKYEVYFCSVEDTAPYPFEFYTLVDIESMPEKTYQDDVLLYTQAEKKFVFPMNNVGGKARDRIENSAK